MSVHPITVLAVTAAITAGVYVNFLMPEPAPQPPPASHPPMLVHELPCPEPSLGDNPYSGSDPLAAVWPGCEDLDLMCIQRAEAAANADWQNFRNLCYWDFRDLADRLHQKYREGNQQACNCFESGQDLEVCDSLACMYVSIAASLIRSLADELQGRYDKARAQAQADMAAAMEECCYSEVW